MTARDYATLLEPGEADRARPALQGALQPFAAPASVIGGSPEAPAGGISAVLRAALLVGAVMPVPGGACLTA